MKRESSDQRIALFIDFENLVTRTGLSAEKAKAIYEEYIRESKKQI